MSEGATEAEGPPGHLIIDVNLGSLIVDGQGEPRYLPDMIIERAARVLVESIPEKCEIAQEAKRSASELIQKALRPVVADALVAAFQPTNRLGEAKGAPTTLREHIVKEAAEALVVKERRPGFGDRSTTLLEQVIRQEVEGALREELKRAVDEARATVLGAVKEQAATVITETIDRVARR